MRFRGLDLNLLIALDALLAERNVSAAARRLFISQSGMSTILAKLRTHFDDDLLVPAGRSMMLTELATRLAEPIHELMQSVDSTLEFGLAFEEASSKRHFRIAASDYVAEILSSKISTISATRAPNVLLELVRAASADSQVIDRGDADILVAASPYIVADHPAEELYSEDHVILGWRENDRFKAPVTREIFFELGHVGVRIGRTAGGPSTSSERYISQLPEKRRVEMICPSLTLVPRLLIGTQRIAVMQRRYAELAMQTLPLDTRPMPFELPKMRMMMQVHRLKEGDAGLQWLKAVVRDCVAELV
ncbi:LysR family transcriptional regulator [Phenylobacterium immobile]|uniref:LysR family transcriptional regulator n=1 Tax=Phenylobacterium immobile TaxID=21 RepID=UPI000B31B614|nr:LysR family transcriptional regulator [Phenylobacterium immobile]